MQPLSEFHEISISIPAELTGSGPPRFQARYRSEVTVIDMETLVSLGGGLGPTGLRLVREWAEEHPQELRAAYELASEGRMPAQIEPLDADHRAEPVPWEITEVEVVGHGVLRLAFADGLRGEVDLLPRLWGPVFERARTPEGFREVSLRDGVVVWPGEVDFAPDTLHERVRTGLWPEALPA
ncbi:MAG TPA: DUF4160 domain-containing protein [Solirubrobacterales bacterium]|jgi:hypothetical protein|nr:DUF4160 domain-containing protein [Solirubrobacterales bacterium]